MDKELLFAQTLEQVKKRAREQGNCIGSRQVEEAFAPLALEQEQMQLIFDYLAKHHIGIDKPADTGEGSGAEECLTREEKDYLQDYLETVLSCEPVSQGEREAITLSAMAGDEEARKRLLALYLPDVAEIARLYAGQGVLLEDLIGEGNMALTVGVGMLGCLEHASEAGGMLGRMIMEAMEALIAEHADLRRQDRGIVERLNEIQDKAKELSEDMGRRVTPRELALETGIVEEEILEAVRISGFQMEHIEVEGDV